MNVFVNMIYLALTIYAWLIVGRAAFSWLHLRPGSALFRIDRVLYTATEPYLALLPSADGSPRRGRHRLELRGGAGRPACRDADHRAPVAPRRNLAAREVSPSQVSWAAEARDG